MFSKLLSEEEMRRLSQEAAKRTVKEMGAAGNIGEARQKLRRILEEAGIPNRSGETDTLQCFIVCLWEVVVEKISEFQAEKDNFIQREQTMRKTIARLAGPKGDNTAVK